MPFKESVMRYKARDHVRLLKYPENSINSHAEIEHIYPDGMVWIANLNMPYSGTISEVVTPEYMDAFTRKVK